MASHPSQFKNGSIKKLKFKYGAAFRPEQVWVESDVAHHPNTLQILDKLSNVPVDLIKSPDALKRHQDTSLAKKQLIISAHRGDFFKPCQGIGSNHICCRYHVIDLISGCPMDCSYCILQSYLANNPITTVYVNLEQIFANVSEFLEKNSKSFYRIGTGELSDSLALDDITGFAKLLVLFFSKKQNALLELKTKTAQIDHLLDLPHRNRTVISWSLNLQKIINEEEIGTSSLQERLSAAKKATDAGYSVGFHLDPIIVTKGDSSEISTYKDLLDQIFGQISPEKISWLSFGMLRFPLELKAIAQRRFPSTGIFNGELVPADGKVRYLRFIREEVLTSLWNHASKTLSQNKLYLCMETEAVWKKVDPMIQNNFCLEKRLTRTESIMFDYRIS